MVSTIAAGVVAAAAADGVLRPPCGRARWGIALIAAGAGLSLVAAADPFHALIGTPDRHFGVATWMLLVGVFVALRGAADAEALRLISRTSAAVVGALGAWTILELAGVGGFASSFAEGRAGGPFGQPAFLGAAAVLLTPLGVGAGAGAGADDPRRRSLATIAAVGGIVALAGSGSRAAMIGAAVAIAVMAPRIDFRRRGPALTLVGAALAVAVLPIGGRFLDAVTSAGPIQSRADEWTVGLRAWLSSPGRFAAGWGPEGYRTVFGRFVDDQYVIEHGREVITDRAHSGIIDIGLSIGLIGLLGWLVLIGAVLIGARDAGVPRVEGTSGDHDARRSRRFIVAGVTGYFVQQLFLFPVTELDLVAFGLLGLIAMSRPQRPAHASRSVAAAATLVAVVAGIAGAADIAADHAIDRTPPNAAAATSLRPDSIRYAFIAGRVESGAGSLESALDAIAAGRDISPRDPALRLEEARLRTELARSGNIEAITIARRTVESFLGDDPRHPALLMQHGLLLALAGETAAAIDSLERAAELAPTAVEPRLNLAFVLLDAGNVDEARRSLEDFLRLVPGSAPARQVLDEISGK